MKINDIVNARLKYNNTHNLKEPEAKEGVISWENNLKKSKKEYTKINEDGSPMKILTPPDYYENKEVDII